MEDGLGRANNRVEDPLDNTPDGTNYALDDVEQRGDEVADGVGHGNRWETSMSKGSYSLAELADGKMDG